MNNKLKGYTLVELMIVCLLIGLIALACTAVVHTIKDSDRIDDVGYKYKIYVTVSDQEHVYYTNSVQYIGNRNAIKFTDKTTEKTYIASEYFIEFN